jgi:hypothetical protein
MVKYITFDSTGEGVIHVPLGSGMFAKYIDATTTRLYYGQCLTGASIGGDSITVEIALTTVSATQALVDKINDAIEEAITSNWREVAHSVSIPSGQSVTSASVTQTVLS